MSPYPPSSLSGLVVHSYLTYETLHRPDDSISGYTDSRYSFMVQRKRKTSLSKLEEKQAALKAEIREVRRLERQAQAELEQQRYMILGRALAKELAENPSLAAQLEPMLNARITKAKDRKLMDLPPLAPTNGTPPSAGQ